MTTDTDVENTTLPRSCLYLDSRQRPRCTECGQPVLTCLCENPDEAARLRLETDPGRFLKDVFALHATREQIRTHMLERLITKVGGIAERLVQHDTGRTPSADVIYQDFVKLGALIVEFAAQGTDEYAYPAG